MNYIDVKLLFENFVVRWNHHEVFFSKWAIINFDFANF
ncbi:hypothetical protein AM2_0530 [Lactococcus cremoris]|nr:hypothetical protein FG2_2681 [Lactococcus cremoris]KZK54734.1 hypothetical protein AM2_0530 [Lactococcus cremoris]